MREKPREDDQPKQPEPQQTEDISFEKEPVRNRPAQNDGFSIKDQFNDFQMSPPTDRSAPAVSSLPGGGLSERSRPGASIRHEITFQDFFRTLDIIKIARGVYRRFWIILLSAFAVMLLFIPLARILQGGVSYTAESVIIYTKPEQKQIDRPGSAFLLRPLSQDTLVDMFLSAENIRELEVATGFQPLEDSVAFDTQSKSDIITLRVNDMPSEQTAIDAVNRLAAIIIENNAKYYRQQALSAYDEYRQQRAVAETEFNKAVKAVEKFQLENELLELNTQYQNYFASVNAAQERLSIAEVAHEGLLVRITNYEQTIAELPEEILNESLEDNPLKRRISNAEAALLDARIQYGAENPKVLRQERELEELRKLLQSGSFDETRERSYIKNPLKGQMEGELVKLRAEEKVAAQQVEALKKDLTKLQARFQELPRLEKEYAALLEERAQYDAALKTLRASEESARLTLESNLSDFKMFSAASSAEGTAASLIGKIIPIAGFVLGFFGGLVLVLLIELLDAKIRTQQQLETAFDAPCLASIIQIPGLESYDTYELLLPSLREISERLNVVLKGRRAKVIGFFSSLNGEGKSVLSYNLARYYSTLNIRVLFVSFDTLVNPCLPEADEFGWPQKGIEDYLRGEAELQDMISSIDGLDMIRVQEPSADLNDLVKGMSMPRLWDLLRQNYDVIITESPSVLDHPVSGTLGGYMDEIIYTIASPVSDRRLADAGLAFLEDRGLVPCALIFNRVDPYYLEDVRQQRIIRNLAEQRNPIVDFFNRFRRPEQKENPPEPVIFDEEEIEDIPDEIGGFEADALPDDLGDDFQDTELDDEISFKDWMDIDDEDTDEDK